MTLFGLVCFLCSLGGATGILWSAPAGERRQAGAWLLLTVSLAWGFTYVLTRGMTT